MWRSPVYVSKVVFPLRLYHAVELATISCPGSVKFCHCGGSHSVLSIDCGKFKFEREILLVRSQENVSFYKVKQ